MDPVNRRLQRLEERQEQQDGPPHRGVLSEETKHALDCMLMLRQTNQYDPQSTPLAELKELYLENGVSEELADALCDCTAKHRREAEERKNARARAEEYDVCFKDALRGVRMPSAG